ncbi:Os02g0293950 [Oryza sativa Japonica Group]|uniref:Os02g0293950 protein n=1 Tax=Oryza sativa subsp. japonica TaxID=39947 RepID=A0A0P0VHX4_ORYSJ|nr:Os02g0293950 [Oryza sativa Japonica Group]
MWPNSAFHERNCLPHSVHGGASPVGDEHLARATMACSGRAAAGGASDSVSVVSSWRGGGGIGSHGSAGGGDGGAGGGGGECCCAMVGWERERRGEEVWVWEWKFWRWWWGGRDSACARGG